MIFLLQAMGDLACLVSAFVFGRLTRHWWDGRPLNLLEGDTSTMLFLASGLLCVALLALGQRDYVRRRPFWEEFRGIIHAVAIAGAANAVLTLITKQYSPVTQYLAAWSSAPLFLILGRQTLKRALLSAGLWQRPTVIVGTGQNALDAWRALASEPLMGFEVAAFISPTEKQGSSDMHMGEQFGAPIQPDSAWTTERLMAYQVVMALEAEDAALQTEMLTRLSRAGHREVFLAPSLRGLALHGMEITHFFRHELLLMSVRNNLARKGPRAIKRLFDIVVSILLLLLLLPLFLWISVRIWLTGSSALFAHQRVGHNGKIFRCLKFQTMVPDADRRLYHLLESDPALAEEWQRDRKLRNDPRITDVGKLLRETSLDELPQLWNVLKGEMSLVGPRPIITEELPHYGEDRSFYLQVRPGITGLWQISGRNSVDYKSRVSLDVWYVRNWSLWYDLVIIMKTLPVILGREGAY